MRNELSALSRKRETLNEEILRLRQRLEQATETNARINRNLEDLVKSNEEKQVRFLLKSVNNLKEQIFQFTVFFLSIFFFLFY